MNQLLSTLLLAISAALSQGNEASLLFAGDAMMHQKQIDVARQADGSYDYSTCFTNIAPLISEADYAVVNLETPLNGAPYSGYPQFNTPDSYVDALKAAGFDMFLTANNHTLDRYDRGLCRTIDVLNAKGVDHLGTYRNAAARDSVIPMVKDINGFKVGFLNYTYGTNGIEIRGNVVVDYIDKEKIKRDVKRTRDAGAELVCVTIHWGDEYRLLPNATQKSLADFILGQGVELLIGGHPHVIQPMEMRVGSDGKKQLLVYSLGNFISNMTKRDTRGGAIVRAHLKRDDQGRAYVDAADYDMVFTIPGVAGKENFHLVYADSCSNATYKGACQEFRRAAKDIFDKHNVDVPQRR